MATAFVMTWTERERGWGQRPDGLSIHPTREAFLAFCKKMFDSQCPADGSVPDEYSRQDRDEPYAVEVPDCVLASASIRAAEGQALWLENRDFIISMSGPAGSMEVTGMEIRNPEILVKMERELLESGVGPAPAPAKRSPSP